MNLIELKLSLPGEPTGAVRGSSAPFSNEVLMSLCHHVRKVNSMGFASMSETLRRANRPHLSCPLRIRMTVAISPAIAPGALERQMNYGSPGNVRELENLVERELIRHRGRQVRFDSLLPGERGGETQPVAEGKVAAL